MAYQQDIFFDVEALPLVEREAILRKAHDICEDWWLDKLDCSESYSRQRIDGVSFDEAMEHFGPDALFRVIHRFPVMAIEKERLEVVFRSMKQPVDYFLWIIVPLEREAEITAGLKELGSVKPPPE